MSGTHPSHFYTLIPQIYTFIFILLLLYLIYSQKSLSLSTKDAGSAPQSEFIGLLLVLYFIYKTATDRRWERLQSSTPPPKKQAPLNSRSNGPRCVSAADHYTGEQYSKTVRTKPRKHLTPSDSSRNTRQHFLTRYRAFVKLLWKHDEGSSQMSSKHQMLHPKYLLRVNGCDWGCIVRDMETIIVLVLPEVYLIPQRLHHSLTL